MRKLKFSLVFADMNSGSRMGILESLTSLHHFRISSAAVPEGALVFCFHVMKTAKNIFERATIALTFED
jgi:hypothetical protein